MSLFIISFKIFNKNIDFCWLSWSERMSGSRSETNSVLSKYYRLYANSALVCADVTGSPMSNCSHLTAWLDIKPCIPRHTLFFSMSTAAHRHNDIFNYKRQNPFHWNCTTSLSLSFSASLYSVQLLSTSHCPYQARVIASICQHTIPCVFHLCSREMERKVQGEWEWAVKMSLCNTCTYGLVQSCASQCTGVQNNVLVIFNLFRQVVSAPLSSNGT